MKIIPRKRRLEAKTNYTKRKRLLESQKNRIVVRKSNRYILMQLIESREAQDKTIFSLSSKKLLEYGWPKEKEGSLKNLGAAYLTGLLFGKKILSKSNKINSILDSGLIRSTKGSKIYSSIKGLVDSGFNISYNEKMFPEEKRIKSEKIKEFFDKVKDKIIGGEK